ncbi:MAG: sulfurtransferase TusA family protein [Candidatus Krumholzibacteria bacterium]|nr:sulfurtransferase TusA family protein [Candidatus Krumholzibacteria bacterium]
MRQDREIKINARGLSNPGPRLMVKSALAEQKCKRVRVVVSNVEAVEDLREYFSSLGASVETDHIGADYHIFVELSSSDVG